MIIIQGQSGTYRHSQRSVPALLADSGLSTRACRDGACLPRRRVPAGRRAAGRYRMPSVFGVFTLSGAMTRMIRPPGPIGLA